MLPFWIFAWIPAAENGFSWDVRLAEFRNFALAVPLFLAAPVMLARAAGWRTVVVAFLGVSVWIAAMGIVEYVFPGVAHLLPGFVGNPDPTIAGTFKRANFSFFGSATAVFICILALPLSLAAWAWWRSVRARIAVAGGAVLQLIALYISGYRSMWLLLGGQAVLYVVVKRKFWLGALFIGLACLGYGLLPDETRDRLHSLEMILQGKPEDVDTSGAKRWNRADDTTQYALEQPTGHGWAASGWVHSDFLQVAANQGLIPAALLLAAYLTALVRLGWRLRSRRLPAELAPLGVPLFLTFAAVGGILLFEGVEFLPQTILPVWLMWALAETWLVQTASPVATAPRPCAGRSPSPGRAQGGRRRLRAMNRPPISVLLPTYNCAKTVPHHPGVRALGRRESWWWTLTAPTGRSTFAASSGAHSPAGIYQFREPEELGVASVPVRVGVADRLRRGADGGAA